VANGAGGGGGWPGEKGEGKGWQGGKGGAGVGSGVSSSGEFLRLRRTQAANEASEDWGFPEVSPFPFLEPTGRGAFALRPDLWNRAALGPRPHLRGRGQRDSTLRPCLWMAKAFGEDLPHPQMPSASVSGGRGLLRRPRLHSRLQKLTPGSAHSEGSCVQRVAKGLDRSEV
jgi:hypothetical protein